jgi:hypothetical protein
VASFAIALATAGAPSAHAHHHHAHTPSPYDVEFEGEAMTMHPWNAGANVLDSGAYLGRARSVFANGAATRTVTTTRPSVHLFVRVKPIHCLGPPHITIRAGGRTWWSGQLNGDGFRDIGVRLSLPAGTHSVEVALTNDYNHFIGPVKVCDRAALVDHVALVASPFAPDGWRNSPLPSDAPIWEEKSAPFRDELEDQVADDLASGRDFAAGVWVSHNESSTPVYTVPFDQPKIRIKAPPGRADLQEQWAQVPLPPEAQPSKPDSGDRVLLVWQPSTDTLWEFIGLVYHPDADPPHWTAGYGGRLTKVSANQGHFPGPVSPPGGPAVGGGYGATATAISLLAGMQRIEEIRRALAEPGVGSLDHAIDLGITTGRGRAGWCWPAQRTDWFLDSLDESAIPGGTRFRFPASFDIDQYAADHNMHPYAEMIAKTIQKHGMIARDSGDLPGWWAEDPTPTGSYQYTAFWRRTPTSKPQPPSALEPYGIFVGFPWDRLEVLAPAGEGCEDDPTPGSR